MSVFVFHDAEGTTAAALVLRAVGGDTHKEDDLVCEEFGCPALVGRSAQWWEWQVREGAADIIVPSALEEGDADDAPFPTRKGLVAFVDGTTSGYVACARSDQRVVSLRRAIAEAAGTDLLQPRGESESPIPDEILDLCDRVTEVLEQKGAKVNGGGFGDADFRVYATRSWVQADLDLQGAVLLEPTDDGVKVSMTAEVYVDPSSSTLISREEADEEAMSCMDDEIAPKLEAIGFRRSDGEAFSDECEHCVGWALVGWNITVSDPEAAAKAILDLSGIETCMRLRFD